MHQTSISTKPVRRIPLWLKIAYTAFMAVLIPVYWAHYGPTNFLYFCDVALLLTLVGVWTESARLISLPPSASSSPSSSGAPTSSQNSAASVSPA
jgi:hypothetical protein